jgi:hypothetical protein
MGKAKRQHWVPRFYLKEFATPETKGTSKPQVWISSNKENVPAKVNVNDIAVKKYLYSPFTEDNERCWYTEDKLAGLESVISTVWPTIANDYVDLNQESIRKSIALFVATMILRHPKNLNDYKDIQSKLIAFYDNGPKDELGRPALKSVEINGEVREIDTSDWEKYSNPTDNDYMKFFTEIITTEATKIAKILMKKRWSIVFSEHPVFITTDCPVITFNQEKEIFGLDTKGTFINFPLSPTRVLVMDDKYDEPHSQYYPLNSHGPGPANFMAWQGAFNFMITGRPPNEVFREMQDYE